MTIARKIARGFWIALAVALAAPAFACANPLLSGYGAPGAGSQALLGSALIGGGPRAGGGSGGSSGDSSAQSIEQPAPAAAAQSAPAGRQATKAPGHRSSHHAARRTASGSSSGASGEPSQIPLVPKSSVHTAAAGLSGGDLALIFAALAMILLTGSLMARLTRGEKREGGGNIER